MMCYNYFGDIMNRKKEIIDDTSNIVNLIKMIVIVAVTFLAFYGITVLVTNNKEKETSTKNENTAVIQYDEILVGQILNRPQNSYYVLIEGENDSHISEYQTYLDSSKTTEKVYYAELSNLFNKKYYSEESNLNADSISQIRFKGTTLLKIENGQIINTYEENENILSELKKNYVSES